MLEVLEIIRRSVVAAFASPALPLDLMHPNEVARILKRAKEPQTCTSRRIACSAKLPNLIAVAHENTKKWQWVLEEDGKGVTSRDARLCTQEGVERTQCLNSRFSVVSKSAIKVNLMPHFQEGKPF